MSNTITAATLAKQGGPQEQAAYLKHFRADNIGESCILSMVKPQTCNWGFLTFTTVKDMEAIRKVLTKDYPENKKKWSVMGQSFGGFCVVNYLSRL